MSRKDARAAALEGKVAPTARQRRYHVFYQWMGETPDDAIDAYGRDRIAKGDVVLITPVDLPRDSVDFSRPWPEGWTIQDIYAHLAALRAEGRAALAAREKAHGDETPPGHA